MGEDLREVGKDVREFASEVGDFVTGVFSTQEAQAAINIDDRQADTLVSAYNRRRRQADREARTGKVGETEEESIKFIAQKSGASEEEIRKAIGAK